MKLTVYNPNRIFLGAVILNSIFILQDKLALFQDVGTIKHNIRTGDSLSFFANNKEHKNTYKKFVTLISIHI